MNAFEKMVYDVVKGNPKFKNKLRNVYQFLFSAIPVKKVKTNYLINIRNGAFFGFHDKVPFSNEDKMLLAQKFSFDDRKTPLAGDTVEIGYYYGDNYLVYRHLSSTKAWNWTQGSMLQWVGEDDLIIFNDYKSDNHYSRIIGLDGKDIDELPLPIGAVDSKGSKALSYNFARLRKGMPGYGYANGVDPDGSINIPNGKGSGLKVVDIKSKTVNELFTVADIANLRPVPSMKNAFHYFTHCLFNPEGDRFVFFHRWLINDNQRFTRMYSCDVSGRNLYLFPTNEMVSHIAWKDDNYILAYANTEDDGDRYYLFEDRTGKYDIVGKDQFSSDGHPQFYPGSNTFITDTYPDRFRRQHLIKYNMNSNDKEIIASLKLPLKYIKSSRCDFHPRWNRNGDIVCFDSAHTGVRSLCTINLNDKIE